VSPETERAETISGKIPTKTAGFESAWKSAVREDWMVVWAVRYKPVSLLFGQYQGDFREKQGKECQKPEKAPSTGQLLAF
jgi:hypothetical protein